MTGGSVAPASHGISTSNIGEGCPPIAQPAKVAGLMTLNNAALPYHTIAATRPATTGAAATKAVTQRKRCAST